MISDFPFSCYLAVFILYLALHESDSNFTCALAMHSGASLQSYSWSLSCFINSVMRKETVQT